MASEWIHPERSKNSPTLSPGLLFEALVKGDMPTCAAHAAPFTGPVSPYYIDNYAFSTIYVVQGTNVVNSFRYAYSPLGGLLYEGNIAVTNVVTTNLLEGGNGQLGPAGQYTLGGIPTGVGHVAQYPPEFTDSAEIDGTSDGEFNYTVQGFGLTTGGAITEDVIRTDLNWQNPSVLFSVQTKFQAQNEYWGITYDPVNNSLWLSGGQNNPTISDYSLSGALLSSFNTGYSDMEALAFDPADDTLWDITGPASTGHDMLEQWSTSGTLLQEGYPTGLPILGDLTTGEFAEVTIPPTIPEPPSILLLTAGMVALGLLRARRVL